MSGEPITRIWPKREHIVADVERTTRLKRKYGEDGMPETRDRRVKEFITPNSGC